MSTVDEIRSAIESLPHTEYMRLLNWLHEKEWREWDKQLEEDAASGKLDFLAEEAMEERTKGNLKAL